MATPPKNVPPTVKAQRAEKRAAQLEAFKKQEAARKRNRLLGIIGAIVALVLVAGTVTRVLVLNSIPQQVDDDLVSGDYQDRLQLFPDLDATHVRGMWRMLCERGADLQLEHSGIEADDTTGKAHWEARYTFSATGRKVHNIIDASFTFRDGKITSHKDAFDFWRWSRQALGFSGVLLGWTPLVQNKIRRVAGQQLERSLGHEVTATAAGLLE